MDTETMSSMTKVGKVTSHGNRNNTSLNKNGKVILPGYSSNNTSLTKIGKVISNGYRNNVSDQNR